MYVRFQNGNGTLFGYLKKETRGTTIVSSIKTYKHTRNGRVEWLAINMQHAGERKWREKLKTASDYISGTKWDGSTNITLERHLRNFRQAYISLEGDAKNIDYQLPNGWTKVQNLLDSIYDCQYTKVCADVLDISNIGCGMSTEFDKAAVFLLPQILPQTKAI